MSQKTARLMAGLLTVGLMSGCTISILKSFPGINGNPTPDPTSTPFVSLEMPAPMFYVSIPATVSADATFSLIPWVFLSSGSWPAPDTIVPNSFMATVNEASKSITLSGLISRKNVAPGYQGGVICLAVRDSAATVSITATASAGTYTVTIPTAYYIDHAPLHEIPSDPYYPKPAASYSLVVE